MSIGRIPQEVLDEIAARCDIVTIVNEYVPLKRRGSNYQGLCPFHSEKTPSFSVSPGKQIFHCFGCGKGGNVFRFIMEIEGISFLEAVEKLAKRAGVELPKQEMTPAQIKKMEEKKRYLQINEAAAMYYHKVLMETKMGAPFRAYLKKRQISEETATKFRLGATPAGWDKLYLFLKKYGITDQEMLDLGLISPSRREGQFIDRFRQRLMFPICDPKGNVIAFGGRIIDKDASPQKYLNSPDTPLFHKSKNLYGIHVARNPIRTEDMAIIVEGYMDVISCYQHGIHNVVAPLGTAFTPEQARLLMRSTYQMALAFDGDGAGQNATMRGLDILADLGCTSRVIRIPGNADPDEFLKAYGKDAFLELVKNGTEMIMYKVSRYMEAVNIDTIPGKTQVIAKLIPDLKKIQSAVAREVAVQKISAALRVSEQAIWQELQSSSVEKRQIPLRKDEESDLSGQGNNFLEEKIESKVEKTILHILFERPDLLTIAEQYGGSELLSSNGAEMYRFFKQSIQENGKVESARIPQEKSQLLADILVEEFYTEDLERDMEDALRQLKQEKLDLEYQKVMEKLAEVEKLGATNEMQEALQKLDSIRRAKKEMETSRKGE